MTATFSPTLKNLAGRTLAALALFCAAVSLHAQFSGPALKVPAQANGLQSPTTDPAILNPQDPDRTLTSGDLVSVKIYGTPDFAPSFRVGTSGSIQLPLIGAVKVSGLTNAQAEALIAKTLKDAGMYLDPQISVQVTESAGQFATVSGELHAVVPLNGSRRLFEVLAAAGPLPINASHVVTILRPGQQKPIIVDIGTDPTQAAQANIQILPRDTILISRVGVVYILGAFPKQGAIPLDQNSPLTLMQATALSGGVGFEGRYEDLRIVRTVGLERKEVKTDIKHVLHGTAPDPVLQADDIVYLPSNALKAAVKSGGIGTLSSILSLLIISLQSRN
jgi:polysaccharide export outer membrane protein